MTDQRIVIVGGGFAGVTLAQELERLCDTSTEIVVVSRDNHLVFTPMLPEVAGRSLSPLHVAVPGRVATKRTLWIEASVTGVDLKNERLQYSLPDGRSVTLSFKHLVLACGTDANLEAVPGLSAHSLSLKTVGDAIQLGNEVIARFEQAASEPDAEKQQKLLHTVVIGGGFSGVEVAGQLRDLMREIHAFYPQLKQVPGKLTLVQHGDRVIPELNHQSLSEFTLKKLTENGIEVLLKTAAAEVTTRGVVLKSGRLLASKLIVNTIGTEPVKLISQLGFELERGRIKTDPSMQVPGTDNLWALGDCAITINAFDGKPTPPTAQFALREAKQLARNLVRRIAGQPTMPFRFRPQGLLASIGRNNGVAEIYGFQFSGRLAWMMWRAIYLSKIPTLSAKIGIALDWMIDAFFRPPIARVRMPGATPSGREHYASGDAIQDSDRVSLVERGRVEVYLANAKKPLVEFQEGDYFGTSLLDADSRKLLNQSSFIAKTPLDLLVIDSSAFAELSKALGPLDAHLQRSLKARQILGSLLRRTSEDSSWEKIDMKSVMVPPTHLKSGATTAAEAIRRFDENFQGYWVTDNDGKIAGYLGRIELYWAIANDLTQPILQIVRKAPKLLSMDQDLFSATLEFLRNDFDTLPVVDQSDQVVGLYNPIVLLRKLIGGEAVSREHSSEMRVDRAI
jgi:NADH:ubiquinone reductase (H+-translocating)